MIRPTANSQNSSGAGIILAANSTLISGGSSPTAGHGITLDNSSANGKILDASVGNADLTFSLFGGGAVTNSFAAPNQSSSYMTVDDALVSPTTGELAFANTTNKSLEDTITVNNPTNANLSLSLQDPYLLIKTSAVNNSDFSGLITSGGTGPGGFADNGWVENLLLNGTALDGAPLPELYLDDGMLEVVPEPGTWALMFAGLTALIFYHRRREGRLNG